MRKIYVAFIFAACFLGFSFSAFAQPSVLGSQVVNGSYSTTNLNTITSVSTFKQIRLQATSSAASGARNWEYAQGTAAATDYTTNWRPYTSGNTLSANTYIPVGFANGARYNTGSGGASGLLPAITSGNYYTFNVSNNASADNVMELLETTFNPVTLSAASQYPAAPANTSGVTVTFTTSATPNASENIFLRYSTDNFTTSNIVLATVSGTSGRVTIPTIVSGTVKYYLFSTVRTAANLSSDVSSYGQGIYDLATLNLLNNSGSLYSYTVGGGFLQYERAIASAGTYTPLVGATAIAGGTTAGTLSTSAAAVGLDDGSALIPMPFNFGYGGTTYSTSNYFEIGSNGYIGFNTTGTVASKTQTSGANSALFTAASSGVVAPWWDDLVQTSTSVSYLTAGTAPNRTFTVQYAASPTYYTTSTSTINFQVVFYESSYAIEFRYGTATNAVHSTSESASAGLRWGGGGPGNFRDAFTGSTTVGNAGMNSENFPTNMVVRFYPSPVAPTTLSAGTYSVGSGGTYTTLSEAIADLNQRGAAGAINFNCTASSYPISSANMYPLLIGPISGTSASNTVTFTGNGSGSNALLSFRGAYSPTVYYSSASSTFSTIAAVNLIGADYITFKNFNIDLSQAAPATTAFATATSRGLYIINNGAADGATNNTFQNLAITLDRTNTSSIGIQQQALTTPTSAAGANSTNKYYNLTLKNMYQGMYMLGNSTYPDLATEVGNTSSTTFNTIGDNATANDLGNGTSATWGIRATSQSGIKIYNNEVSNITVTSSSTANGIFLESAQGSSLIYRNKVHDIKSTSTSVSAVLSGIRTDVNSGGTATVYNNFVYSFSHAISTASATMVARGIACNVGANTGVVNIYQNSVVLNLASTAATSACLYTQSGTTVARNNILVNTNTGAATSKRYGIYFSSGSLTSNNNDLYVTTGTNNFIGGNGTDYTTLAAWQGATGSPDAASINVNPTFTSATDLHLNYGTTPTQLESGGASTAVTGITDDIDAQVRPGPTTVNGGGTSPDIGADEVDMVPQDLTPPTITYTPITGSCSSGARTFTATITDASGIGTGANLPVCYFKINSGSYSIVTGTSIGSNQYTFSIGTGSVAGDVVSYYVVAQDNAPTPNVAVSPSAGSGGTSSNPPRASTPPTTPSSYTNNVTLNGAYTVGVGGNYTTLTAAIAAYNGACLAGPVVFNLTDASYTTPAETFPISINAVATASATNTLTIKPSQSATTISGTSASALIVLNGADYITIDGSINSNANTVCPASTASRDLTLTNANTGTSSAVIWLQTTAGSDAATNNTIKNLNLAGSGNTQTLFGVGSGSSTISTSSLGTSNNNNSFVNNNISKTQYGIYSQGASAATKNTGTLINQNLINTSSPNNVALGGIWIGYDDGAVISGNNISGLTTTQTLTAISLGIAPTAFAASTATGNDVVNATVAYNIIGSVTSTSATGYSAGGIVINQVTTGTTNLSNNMIYGVSALSTSPDIAAGIFVGGGTGSTTNIYYNTVSMSGTRGAATYPSFALAINGSNPVVNVKNNILINTQTSTGAGKSYAFGLAYTSYGNLTSNNNDLYTGTSSSLGVTGSLGTSGTDQTFATWQSTAPAKDAASKNISPVFVSSTDLHLSANNAANATLNATATPVSVTTDIDCTTRDASTPDIGADEFAPNCSAPTAQPTNLVLTPSSGTVSIAGTFTAALPAPSGYLVVRTTTNSAPSPVNGTPYTVGASGIGYIESAGTGTSFTSSVGLTAGNIYYYWVFSYNNTACAGGPVYFTTNPLTGNATAPTPCATPTAQPTNLVFSNVTASTITGNFSASSPASSDYLVVRTTSATPPTPGPADATAYAVGTNAANTTAFGTGAYVESAGPATTFTSTGLTPGTTYYYYIYSFSNTSCTAGPLYLATSPLTNNQATISCIVPGTYTVGPTGNYSSVTQVVNLLTTCSAISPLSGAYIFELQAAYNSSVETFPLAIPYFPGSSATNSVTFRPAAAATNVSITSSNTTGTINLNGAQYVFFDGRLAGSGASKNLTIENTNVGISYALQFINDAAYNTIEYCNVKSANSSVGASGTISFVTTTGTTGNDNNTIDNNDIFDAASGTPTNAIFSLGTTTTAATNNSNDVISNNNIYNFYNATSTTSGGTGISLNGGTTDWTIAGNSFYQTSTRSAFGLGTITSAININNTASGNNFSITGNYFGGTAPACGGTPYTLNASTTLLFKGFLVSAGSTVATLIQNNTIKNISITTTSGSSVQGVIVAQNGAFTINNNTIGAQDVTGSIAFSSSGSAILNGILAGVGTTSQGLYTISNNTIGGISVSGAGTNGLRGISYQTAATPIASTQFNITGNTIGSLTTPNSFQNSSNNPVFGIIGTASQTTSTNNVTGNTIANVAMLGTGTGNQLVGISSVGSVGGMYNVSGNTVFNLSSVSTATNLVATSSVIGISQTAATTTGQTVSGNTIYNLSNSTPSTAVGLIGIYFVGPTSGTNLVAKNLIYSISTASSSIASSVTGIYANTGTATFQNNMVRLGTDDVTAGHVMNGIFDASGTNNYYFNSVYIGGASVPTGGSNTYAFKSSVTTNTRIFQDNIFVNARSNAAGSAKHYAVTVAGTTANPTGLTIGYNDYYVSGSGGVFGFFNSADVADIAAWRTAVGQDAASVSGDPQFIAPLATTANLHISTSTATPIEASGLAISGITDDIDGDTRASLTPTDMGADAGNFIVTPANDIAAVAFISPVNGGIIISGSSISPQASFLNNGTATQSNITVQYTIRDAGNAIVYSQIYVIASLAPGVSTTVTFPTATLGGAGGAYTIQAAAQLSGDQTTSNDIINGTVTALSPLCGDYHIGTAQAAPFNTLTAAVARLNAVGVSCPVRFLLDDVGYSASETFPITINTFAGSSTTNTVTILPNAGQSTSISGSATTLIKLAGADNIIIDGSNAGGTSRNLTLSTTSTSASAAIVWATSPSAADAATGNAIKNCIIAGSSATTTGYGIAFGGTTTGSLALASNSNNTIQNNQITAVQIPVNIYGVSGTTLDAGNVVTQNNIGTSSLPFGLIGVQVQYQNGFVISQNDIQNLTSSGSGPLKGIAIVECKNGVVSKNAVHKITYTGGSVTKIFAINTASGTNFGTSGSPSANTFSNNLVYDINSNCTSSLWNTSGINDDGGYGDKFYFNSVNINAAAVDSYTSGGYPVAAFSNGNANLGTTASAIDVRDNIFSITGAAGYSSSTFYGNYIYTGTYSASTLDNNDIYVSLTSGSANIGYQSATGSATLAAWRTATGKEASSISADPLFLSSTNLQIQAGSPVLAAGVSISGITTDYAGATRNSPPTIGAYETSVSVVAISSVAANISGGSCSATPRTITATLTAGATSISTVVLSYSYNGGASTPVSMTLATGSASTGVSTWTGVIPAATPTNATVTWSVSATDAIATKTLSGTSYQDDPLNGLTVTAAATVNPVCSGSPTVLSVSLSGPAASATYTTPSVSNATTDEDLGNVTITQAAATVLNNTTTRNSLIGSIGTASGTAGSYSNFTGFGPYTLTAGQTYNFSLTSLDAGTSFSHYMYIYMDYNRDGLFTGPGETVYASATSTSGAHTESGSFTVPATALSGKTRMRIVVSESALTGASTTTTYGEFEDYLINVVPSVSSYSWSDGTSVVGTTNPLTVNPTATTSYTATITNAAGCTASSTPLAVTVNPLPTGPTSSSPVSTCGAPSFSVTAIAGATNYYWYDGAGSTATQVGSTGTTNSFTPGTYNSTNGAVNSIWVSYNTAGGCESQRTQIDITELPAPIIAITANQVVCNNSYAHITVSVATLGNYGTYVWTATGGTLYSDNAGTAYVAGTNSPDVYFKTSTAGSYTITASATGDLVVVGSGCTAVATTTVAVQPGTVTIAATNTALCGTYTPTLTASPSTGYSTGTLQWQQSTTSITGPWSDIAGATSSAYTPSGALTQTTYYQLLVKSDAGTCLSPSITATVNNPLVLTTTPSTRCGTGTVSLAATGNTGSTLNWYASSSGGSALATGATFVTPTISATTTYYVSATAGGSTTSGGKLSTNGGDGTNTTGGIYFTANSQFTLNSVVMYPTGAGTNTIVLYSGSATSGTPIYTANYTFAGANASGVTVPLAWSIPAGNYTIYQSVSNALCWRDASGGISVPATAYPYNIGTAATLTGGSLSGYYYYFYNWNISTGCESGRTAVTATVNTAPSITTTASPAAICAGTTSTLTASSSNDPNYTYSWTPSATLNSGTGSSVVATPTGTTSYTVTAIDNTSGTNGGCAATGSVTVTVNLTPSTVTVTPASTNSCTNVAQLLTASGGTVSGPATALLENFNGGAPAWTITNSSSVSTVNWYYQSAPYTDASGSATFSNFTTTDGGSFAYSNSDVGGSGSTTNTILTSPAFSLVNYTAATLTFEHAFRSWSSDATVKLQISTDGGSTWSDLVNYLGTSVGTITNGSQTTANASVDLTPYVGQSNIKIRYNYASTWGYYWILDNVKVAGTANIPTNITWTPTTGLYTNAAGTTAYTGTATNTVYAMPASSTSFTAVATSTAAGACSTSSANVAITVNQPSLAATAVKANAAASATICNNGTQSITLTQTGGTLGTGANWHWYKDAAFTQSVGTSSASDASLTLTVGTPIATTTYYVTAENNASPCTGVISDNTKSVTVTVSQPPTATIAVSGTNPICNGSSSSIAVTITGGVSPYTVIYSDGTTNTTVNNYVSGTNISVSPTSTTTYTIVSVTGANSCSGGTYSGSAVVNVNQPASYVNLQFPGTGSICTSGTFTAYGQIYKLGVTEAAGQGAGITADLGYSTTNTNPNTWTNWVPATFNVQSGNNDEYKATLSGLAAGTYYYAYRFQTTPCGYQYGGYTSTGGGIWDGTTNVSGVLTVNTVPTASVIAGSSTICNGSSANFTVTVTGGTSPYTVIYSDGTTNTTVNSYVSGSNITVSPTTTTTYTLVSVTSAGGCASGGLSGSAVITVNQPAGYVNTQFPGSGTICQSVSYTVYGQVYKLGVTEAAGQGAGITAELGYSTTNSNPSTWTNWQAATFNTQSGNNDEYKSTLTGLAAGTYYYAYRFQTTPCGYQYGGYSASGGGTWNGTSNVSGVLTISPNANSGTISGSTTVCAGSAPTFTTNGDAGGVWSIDNTAIATINASTGVVTPVSNGTANITYTVNTGCSSPVHTTIGITVTPDTWTGATSSDWFTASNWCGSIPTAGMNVIIAPSTHNPDVASGLAFANNITIQSGAQLKVDGSGILSLHGTISNSGTLDMSAGTLRLAGTNQVISGSLFSGRSLKNLVDSTSASLSSTANDTLNITGLFSFGNVSGSPAAIFTTHNNLTLKSTINGTAAIADITNNGATPSNSISGNANVERYINTGRKWHLLAVNTISTQKINNAWMEGNAVGANTVPGFGTWVTGLGGTTNHFDYATTTPTIKWWDGTLSAYNGITDPTTDNLVSHSAYMVYVRGDRTCTGQNSNVAPTVLRSYGGLKQNDQAQPTIPAGSLSTPTWFTVGNPYASNIDLSQVTFNSSATSQTINIAVWDPTLGGGYNLGAFRYLQASGPNQNFVVSLTAGYPNPNIINSGQGFFVQATDAARDITFTEDSKTQTAGQVFFTAGSPQKLAGTLNIKDAAAGTLTPVDGVLVQFSSNASNDVDFSDARKLANTGENVSVKKPNAILAIESRNLPDENDTIQLNMTGVRYTTYNWQFDLTNMDQPGRTAFLIDRFAQSETALDLAGGTGYDFTVNATAGSYAADRFLIVFRPAAVVAVRSIAITASKQTDGTNLVKWSVENELNIAHYELERSADAVSFAKIETDRPATNNVGGSASYSEIDTRPINGVNFYRVKAISNNGQVQYSAVVKVTGSNKPAFVSVFPNPVANKTIHLVGSDVPAATYQLRVVSADGKTIYSGSISISGDSFTTDINLGKSIAAGKYTVVLQSAGAEFTVPVTVLQ